MSKGPKEFQPINPLWVVIVAIAVGVLVSQVASATGDNRGPVTQEVDIAGDSSKALGIGFSSPSFTAAINQCIATEAENWFFGAYGKQKVVPNYHCMGLAYLQAGMIDAGEYILCKHTELSEMPDCEKSVSQYVPRGTPEPVTGFEDYIEQHEEEEGAHVSQLQAQQIMISTLSDSLDNLEASSKRASRRYAEREASDKAYALEVLQQVKELE